MDGEEEGHTDRLASATRAFLRSSREACLCREDGRPCDEGLAGGGVVGAPWGTGTKVTCPSKMLATVTSTLLVATGVDSACKSRSGHEMG